MEAPSGIDADLLNEVGDAFEIAVKQEPMLTHVAEFMMSNFEERGIDLGGGENFKSFMDGFCCGFCYLTIMLKTGEMRMECFETNP